MLANANMLLNRFSSMGFLGSSKSLAASLLLGGVCLSVSQTLPNGFGFPGWNPRPTEFHRSFVRLQCSQSFTLNFSFVLI